MPSQPVSASSSLPSLFLTMAAVAAPTTSFLPARGLTSDEDQDGTSTSASQGGRRIRHGSCTILALYHSFMLFFLLLLWYCLAQL